MPPEAAQDISGTIEAVGGLPPFVQLAVICAAAGLAGLYLYLKFRPARAPAGAVEAKVPGKPLPLQTERLMTNHDVGDLHKKIEISTAGLRRELTGQHTELSREVGDLRDTVGDLRETVAGMRAAQQAQGDQLSRILDRLPGGGD